MDKPHHLYLVFANQPENPLKNLQKEYEEVQELFIGPQSQGHYLAHCLSSANLEYVAKKFNDIKEKLFLFHYSGHAGKDLLALNEQHARPEGIAHLLGQCPELKLVVLNACATASQVDALLGKGVPVVIATNAEVDDEVAMRFSLEFYRALVMGDNIKKAFNWAEGHVKTRWDVKFHKANRGIEGLKSEIQGLQWGLFYSEKNELRTKLPMRLPSGQPMQFIHTYIPNELLFDTLMHALSGFNEEIRALQEKEEEEKGSASWRNKANLAIIEAFPLPIAEQIRKLLSDEGSFSEVSLDRIRQISTVYQVALEMLAFTMISHLWEVQMKDEEDKKTTPLPSGLQQSLKEYFSLGPQAHSAYDYIPLIRQIRQYFDGRQVAYFIEELEYLKDLFQEDEDFSRACDYLSFLRRRSQHNAIDVGRIPQTCQEAEEKLRTILANLGFLSRYRLVSIKNIDVRKYHHHPQATFNHTLIGKINPLGSSGSARYVWKKYMDNRGALLMQQEADIPGRKFDPKKKEHQIKGELGYLNLSPFVFDLNAFDDNANKVRFCFFSHYEAGTYYFEPVGEKSGNTVEVSTDFRQVSEIHFVIREQFEAFRELMLR